MKYDREKEIIGRHNLHSLARFHHQAIPFFLRLASSDRPRFSRLFSKTKKNHEEGNDITMMTVLSG